MLFFIMSLNMVGTEIPIFNHTYDTVTTMTNDPITQLSVISTLWVLSGFFMNPFRLLSLCFPGTFW